MPRNVVVCCDGTSNQYSQDRTNVVKLFSALRNDPAQVTFYHPGVGTMGAPGSLTQFDSLWTTTFGLAFGYGLPNDIRDAYVFLMNNYEDGDRLFIFGFSRGAYTARALASVLHMYGLLRHGNEPLVPYAIQMMEAINKANEGSSKSKADEAFALAAGFKATFSRPCKPWFMGVWDTVSSVGWIGHPLALPYSANNPDIAIGRHAMAIDERRSFFPPNLWWPSPSPHPAGPKDLKQVWFPGVHCDVGGGYAESESGQAKYALEWMIVESREHGLLFDDQQVRKILGHAGSGYAAPDYRAPLHESLTWKWWPAEFVPKKYYDRKTGKQSLRMNLFRRREIPDAPLVHESAYLRGPEYMKTLPVDSIKVERVAA